MAESFAKQEAKVIRFFRYKASIDDFSKSYAYMNCITLKDRDTEDIDLEFIVTSTDNDDIEINNIIYWSEIDEYITTMLKSGAREDIECLYCFLKDSSIL